jgi:hypothetical protein
LDLPPVPNTNQLMLAVNSTKGAQKHCFCLFLWSDRRKEKTTKEAGLWIFLAGNVGTLFLLIGIND